MITQEKIIKSARSWIGTKFHHAGRVKFSEKSKGGVDCLGLIIGVSRELQLKSKMILNNENVLLSELDVPYYSHNITDDRLNKVLKDALYEVKIEDLDVADLILFKIQKQLKHLAIFSYDENIIHAAIETKGLVEHHFSDYWKRRIFSVFRFVEMFKIE